VVNSDLIQNFIWGSTFITLSGKVEDADEIGVCGAIVEIRNNDGFHSYAYTATDGSYSMPAINGIFDFYISYYETDSSVCVNAVKYPSYSASEQIQISVDTVKNFTLPPVYTVSGRLADQSDIGVGSAYVYFQNLLNSHDMSGSTTTGSDGNYSVDLYPGTYDVFIGKDSTGFTGIKGLVVNSDLTQNFIWGVTITPEQVETPTFSSDPGTYTSVISLTLLCSTPSASIHFTTNGEDPTYLSESYVSPITISSTTTIKAKAFKNGLTSSATAVGTYTIHDAKTITASAGTGGTISPSGTVTVNYGSDQPFNITPNKGYSVVDVTVDGSSVSPAIPAKGDTYTFTEVTANHTISATFAKKITYTITASAGTGGTISPSGQVSVNDGANQTFSITPSTGYIVSDVTVDGSSVSPVIPATGGTYKFAKVTANHTISAIFEQITASYYTITASAGNGGTISPSGPVSVIKGSSREFNIKANTGYSISKVLVDKKLASLTNGTYTFTDVVGDHTISVTFTKKTAAMRQLSGIWSDGVRLWDQSASQWAQTHTDSNVLMLISGKVNSENDEDLVGVWPSGVYTRQYSTKEWVRLCQTLPTWITTGDINNDGMDDIIGSWPADGIYCLNLSDHKWNKISLLTPEINIGSIGWYNRDDFLSILNSSLQIEAGNESSTKRISTDVPVWITIGDKTNNKQPEIFYSCESGTWYRNPVTETWQHIASPSEQIIATDIDGDGYDDLIGIWSDGVWVRYGNTEQWEHISTSKPLWIFTSRTADVIQPDDSLDDPVDVK